MLSQPKNRKAAAALAFLGVVSPFPLAGLHKFYLGQPFWGVAYLLLWWTQASRIASAFEGAWYLLQDDAAFNQNFNRIKPTAHTEILSDPVNPTQVGAIADALRQLDQLRQEGLISEYEFEQKRRSLLDRIV
ncbi:MAG: NINE protein [Cyanothece sp. SIO1E1]|nr:NINE protein [Cyanothece sp. SIO1E1]